MNCPVCNAKLQEISEEAHKRLYEAGNLKYDDEEIYFCPRCGEYIYEEDFLYNNLHDEEE